jgi:hypothetical protein
LSRVKGDMEREQRQELALRRLLKARENQTTADALSDLLLNTPKPLIGSHT